VTDQIHVWTADSILAFLRANRQKLLDLGVQRIGLFGSYARGEQQIDSDIDILVTMQRPSFDDYMDTKFFLEDAFGHQVDLVPENGVKEALRPTIMREVLYVENF
jgi:hypothetical protein